MSHHKYKAVIDACSDCAAACAHCEDACLDEDDVKMLTRCIKVTHDCAAICLLTLSEMASQSEFAGMVGHLCAEICNACAAECEKHVDMKHCVKCAEACRACAAECLKMINA